MDFPRCVYRLSSVKLVPGGGEGELTAEQVAVHSQEQLDALGDDWADGPVVLEKAKSEPKPKKVK